MKSLKERFLIVFFITPLTVKRLKTERFVLLSNQTGFLPIGLSEKFVFKLFQLFFSYAPDNFVERGGGQMFSLES